MNINSELIYIAGAASSRGDLELCDKVRLVHGAVRELIAAAQHVENNLQIVDGTQMDAVLGPTYMIRGISLNRLRRVLADVGAAS